MTCAFDSLFPNQEFFQILKIPEVVIQNFKSGNTIKKKNYSKTKASSSTNIDAKFIHQDLNQDHTSKLCSRIVPFRRLRYWDINKAGPKFM